MDRPGCARAARTGRLTRVSAVLLFVIAAAAPWAVHLAPPRQRPLALVGALAALLLYAIFVANPITTWALWAGLAAGMVSVLLMVGAGQRRAGPLPSRRRRPLDEPRGQQTGES